MSSVGDSSYRATMGEASPGDPGAAEQVDTDVALLERTEFSEWQTIVWDDPVNLMSYVTYVFKTHFGFSEDRAEELMLRVHNEGRAVVAEGAREEMEYHAQAMQGYGLWATVRKRGGE